MAKIYYLLIKKGLKTLDEVPNNLRLEVEMMLNEDSK